MRKEIGHLTLHLFGGCGQSTRPSGQIAHGLGLVGREVDESLHQAGRDSRRPAHVVHAPVSLAVEGPGASTTGDPKLDHDRDVTFEINVHEDFRWRDENKAGYAAGSWDTEPPAYEPVVTFGANSFRVYTTP